MSRDKYKNVWLPMRKILIVDDTPIVRAWVRLMLGRFFNVSIDEAHDGLEAMELLVSNKYALVLMDLNMPMMNGFECTAKIREQEKTSGNRIPIICMTTANNTKIKDECLEAGMDDYLNKDCTDSQFESMIRRWLFRAAPSF